MVVAAYRAQARLNHPDIAPGQHMQHRMAQLNAAYAILRDPAARAAWDSTHGLDQHASHALSRPQVTTDPAVPAPGTSCTWLRGPEGIGAAGPPPGRPSGSVLMFGRHLCWSIGEIARVDPGYLQWLLDRPEGRPYRGEIEAALEPLRQRSSRVATAGPPAAAPRPRTPFWKR